MDNIQRVLNKRAFLNSFSLFEITSYNSGCPRYLEPSCNHIKTSSECFDISARISDVSCFVTRGDAF